MGKVATVFAVVLAVLAATHAEEAPAPKGARVSQAWRPLPGGEMRSFRFVVMADNQPHDAVDPTQTEVFKTSLKEATLLGADLAIFVGDLIHGFDGDAERVRRKWDAFDAALAEVPIPYRMTVGNNDVFDPSSEAIWKERYGQLRHAFSLGGCRFLCLNSEEAGTGDRISAGQIAWIAREVEAAKDAPHLFVFIHKPLWRSDPGATNWLTEVHPVIARHPSAHVFAGHYHHYERSNDRDGVRYTITGAAGGPISRVEATGEFHCYLHVSVKGPRVDVAVVRPGGILPETVVEEDRWEEIVRVRRTLDFDPLLIGNARPLEVRARFRMENLLTEPLEVAVDVELPEGGPWTVAGAGRTATIPPGEKAELSFDFRSRTDPFPPPKVRVVARAAGEVVIDQDGVWPVRFDRRLEVGRAKAAPVIDGKLDEAAWKGAVPAGRFLTYTGDAFATRATILRALWNDERLFVSFELEEPDGAALIANARERDWTGISDDCLLFYVDLVRDGRSRHFFGVNAGGVPADYRAPGGIMDRTWSGPWEVAVTRGGRGWTAEAAIPWKSLGHTPEKGGTFGFAAYRNATPGGREISGWTVPDRRLSNPSGFGEAVLR